MSDASFNFILYVDIETGGGGAAIPPRCFRYTEKQAARRFNCFRKIQFNLIRIRSRGAVEWNITDVSDFISFFIINKNVSFFFFLVFISFFRRTSIYFKAISTAWKEEIEIEEIIITFHVNILKFSVKLCIKLFTVIRATFYKNKLLDSENIFYKKLLSSVRSASYFNNSIWP